MRSKLKLQMEDLSVESFDTDAPRLPRGTVFGCQVNTCGASCAGGYSCWCPTAAIDCTLNYERTCNGNGTCGVYPCQRYVGTE